jgi:predicted nucleic acid-binding protein
MSDCADDLSTTPKVEILAIGREAGFLAGRLRALAHHPPDRGRRDARTKPERRVSWLLDLQIAAAAWASGCDVATENNGDFEAIADLLAAKLGLEPLIVHRSPL